MSCGFISDHEHLQFCKDCFQVITLFRVFMFIVLAALFLIGCTSCTNDRPQLDSDSPPIWSPPAPDADLVHCFDGLQNVVLFHRRLFSGSAPQGHAGFESLSKLGIRTVISVDSSVPDVERAGANGIRYIHLPIGYHGFTEDRRLQLARAARDSMELGGVYVHCQHGKHRSASAAASIIVTLGLASPAEAVARMQLSGTSSQYPGLFAVVHGAERTNNSVLDRLDGDFPDSWTPSSFVQNMVAIDLAFSHLKLIETSGWTTPREHPDLQPIVEASLLADRFRDLTSEHQPTQHASAFASLLNTSHESAMAIEHQLLKTSPDIMMLRTNLAAIERACIACHAQYRN